MKISIENFKSIRKLQNFEIKPLTILSGVNSSGKSSFVQLLLILKQTIELDSSKKPFFLHGEYTNVKNFKDIIYNKKLERKLKVSFEFSKSEFHQLESLKTVVIFKTFSDYTCLVEIEYDINQETETYISAFSVRFNFVEDKDIFIVFKSNMDTNTFSIDTNSAIFENALLFKKLFISNIHYSSLYPDKYESETVESTEIGDHKANVEEFSKETINLEDIKMIINSFLKNISYLKPIREEPKDEYIISNSNINVGVKGEFVAQILEEKAKEQTTFYIINEQENSITYEKITKTLIESVKYWMCTVFEVAIDIKTEKINDIYKIIFVNKSELETTVKHVGFGISQLLPIVVEGLRMPKNGTFIIEQPEVHLHPKLQSKLFDFLYGLTLQGKKVIVETHSSHFITRMRRRIAEDVNNKIDDQINLTFIENNTFKSIELDDYGTLNYYPKDFIEPSNTELRAIVKAQTKKRRKNG